MCCRSILLKRICMCILFPKQMQMFVGIYPFTRPFLCYCSLWGCCTSCCPSVGSVWWDQKRARASLMQAVHCKLESQVAKHLTFLLLGSAPCPLLLSLTFACDQPLATWVRMNQTAPWDTLVVSDGHYRQCSKTFPPPNNLPTVNGILALKTM